MVGDSYGFVSKCRYNTLDIDISRLSDLKEYEVVTVVGVQYNDIFDSYSIECK